VNSGLRLFVAITPPADALRELDAALGPARVAAPSGLRWTRPEQWHLTLAFFGSVPQPTVPALAETLGAACRAGALRLRFFGGGCFGDRVLWVGIAGDTNVLRSLAAGMAAAAHRFAVAISDEPYRPHLTLARAGRVGADLRPAAGALAEVVGSPWSVCSVQLVHSRLGAGPGASAVHSPIATWPLGQE
jgi:2'-5' RNA ligase